MEGIIIAIKGDVVKSESSNVVLNINDSPVIANPDGTNIFLVIHNHIGDSYVKTISLVFTGN
jgi:F0F1-type ATP synthase beta subunit